VLKQVFENPTLLRNALCRSVVTSVRKGAEMSVENTLCCNLHN